MVAGPLSSGVLKVVNEKSALRLHEIMAVQLGRRQAMEYYLKMGFVGHGIPSYAVLSSAEIDEILALVESDTDAGMMAVHWEIQRHRAWKNHLPTIELLKSPETSYGDSYREWQAIHSDDWQLFKTESLELMRLHPDTPLELLMTLMEYNSQEASHGAFS